MNTLQNFGVWLAIIGLVLVLVGESESKREPVYVPEPPPGSLIALKERLQAKGYTIKPMTVSEKDASEENGEIALDDWHIGNLARAHHAAHTAGNREVRDLVERVLEDVEPDWRLYA